MVTFLVRRPFADQMHAVVSRWLASRELVFFWEAPDLLFGVFWSSDADSRSPVLKSIFGECQGPHELKLDVDIRDSFVPVYFDFEAAWSKLSNLEGTLAYPRGLPGTYLVKTQVPGDTSVGRTDLAHVIGVPFLPVGSIPWKGMGHGPASRRMINRELRAGRVEHRAFLCPTDVSRWAAGFPTDLVLIYGDRIPGDSPSLFFRELVEKLGLSPFLFGADKDRVIIALLSGGALTRASATDYAGSVLAVLQRYLQSITTVREPLSQITAHLEHRYDRLIELGLKAV